MTLSYCGETVRKHDPDRFLLSLFAPKESREALWALYAFNHEIAKTREVVTDTQLGLIRLQWWRDAIGAVYEGKPAPDHPVMKPLALAIVKYDLPRELFDNLVYAREFDLEDRQPPTVSGMLKYAELTSAPLMQLSLLCHSERSEESQRDPSAVPQDDIVIDVSIAYAMTGLLRAVPFHLSQRRCYLPENLVPPVSELYEARGLGELKVAVKTIIETVTPAQAGGWSFKKEPDARLRGHGAFLKAHFKLAELYLAQIVSVDCDLFSPALQRPPFLKELRLWWASI